MNGSGLVAEDLPLGTLGPAIYQHKHDKLQWYRLNKPAAVD